MYLETTVKEKFEDTKSETDAKPHLNNIIILRTKNEECDNKT